MAKAHVDEPIASVPGPGDIESGTGRHGPMIVPPGMVRIKSVSGAVGKQQLYRPLGPMKPRVVSGYGGWQVTQRPRDIGLTDWIGREPMRVQFQVLIDSALRDIVAGRPGRAFGDRLSCEKDCRTLEKMAGLTPGSPEPPKVIFDGGRGIPHDASHAKRNRWVIEVLEWDEEYDERNSDGERTRALATLTMMQYVKDERIPRLTAAHRRKQKKDKKKGGGERAAVFGDQEVIIRAREGDTLVKIAARHLGNAKLWTRLAKINGIRDGRRVLKKGRKIKLFND